MEDSLQSAKAKLEKLGGMFVPNSAPGELVTGAIADIDAALCARLAQDSLRKLPNLTLDPPANRHLCEADADESQRKSRTVKAPKSPVTFEIEL